MKWIQFALACLSLALVGTGVDLWDRLHPTRAERTRAVEHLSGPIGAVLLIGDSITQASWVWRLCGLPVVNAGIAGSTVEDWERMAPALVQRLKPRIVVYALGVNDADKRLPFDPAAWDRSYRNLRRGGYVLGVLHTQSPDFSNARIDRMNAMLAKEPGYVPPFPTDGLTWDGVHLNRAGKRVWDRRLRAVCQGK